MDSALAGNCPRPGMTAFPRRRTRPILSAWRSARAAIRPSIRRKIRPGRLAPRRRGRICRCSIIRWPICSIPASARGVQASGRRPVPLPQGGGEAQASKLAPPSDNSWDRRADFANAHRARKSTQQAFAERPQAGYAAQGALPISIRNLPRRSATAAAIRSKPLIGGRTMKPPMNPRFRTATKFPTFPSRGAKSATGRRRSR